MSLQIWLPLNGDLHNQGLSDLTVTGIGTVAYDNLGKIGKCFISGGTSQVANGVNLNTNLVDILNSSAGSSVALWVKPVGNHYHYDGTFISSGDWNSTCWSFGVSQDNSKVDMLCKGHSQYITCAVPVNTWTHLVCTFKDGTSKLYKNGAYVGQVTDKAAFASNASNTCIGRETYASGYFGFNGRINDVRIYDHALSPKEVEEIAKGLVLHYKLDDRFCEATTNLCTSGTLSNSCFNGATNKYSYGTTTDMYKTIGVFQGRQSTKVYMGTAGNSAYPYVFFDYLHPAENTYKTLSFDYYPTSQTSLIFYTYDGSGTTTYSVNNGPITSGTSIPVELNKWNHIVFTILGTSSKTSGWGYVRIGSTAHTSTTTDYWLFANIQIEAKDHVTPYTPSTRIPTTVYDSSGYSNNGTIVGNLAAAAGSPRYDIATQFPGSAAIKFLDFNLGNIWSAGIWFKSPSTATQSWSSLFAVNNNGGDTDLKMNIYYQQTSGDSQFSANGQYTTGVTGISKDQWHHIMEVFNGSTLYCYLDGDLKTTKAITNAEFSRKNLMIGARSSAADGSTAKGYFNGQLSDFRIYATALTAEQVADLYHTSMSVDSSGNIHARELQEV